MRTSRHIAVLFHENSIRSDLEESAIFHIAEHWRDAGHRVTFLRGTRRLVPADLLFVHVDLSVVPEKYLEFAAHYPATVNLGARDIRKSRISPNLVRPGDAWNGPVIVKSDLNCGGDREFWLGSSPLLRSSRLGLYILRRSPRQRRISPFRGAASYAIFERLDRVPEALVNDPRMVIERFVPEMEGGLYHVRFHQFLGDRVVARRIAGTGPLVKANNMVRSERIPPDPRVEEWRREMAFDYGKFDYVVHDGTPLLLDANKTTGIGPHRDAESDERRRYLAGGIDRFFPDQPRPQTDAADCGTIHPPGGLS